MADYIEAHRVSSDHRERLLKDEKCGCFHCLEIFDPKEITDWIEDPAGTAVCPYCGVDAVMVSTVAIRSQKNFWKK